jgi:replicative DNA helicase
LRSHEKRVPDSVFAQDQEGIARFLRHLWSTDGSLWTSSNLRPVPRIYFASSSRELADDVRSLLLRIEINARITRHPQGSKGRDQYHVDITGVVEQLRFLERVGAVGVRRQQTLEAIQARLRARTANTNRDVIPRAIWATHATPARRAIGLTDRQFQMQPGMHYCGSTLYHQNLSRDRLARVAKVVASDYLQRLASSDVYWDAIATVEYVGETEVYDLTVEGLHNFVAGDVIVHNSIEQDSDIVMFIYRDEVYDPNTERKGIAEIIVAKHRNGPVGSINLRFFEKTARFADLELYRESSA